MARKEHKGGILTNEEIDRDNNAKGRDEKNNPGYSGMQDTGDQKIREKGGDVQKTGGPMDEKVRRKIN